MYSSGSPEGGSDSSENRGEFHEKLQRARAAVKPPSANTFPIFTKASEDLVITVGNWNLSSKKDGEISIINSDGQQQATVLREDLPGFLFESNRGTKHTFTAETSLGPEFSGWTCKKTKRLRSKAEAVKQKVKTLARDIYENHFRVAQSKPRGVVAKLTDIVSKMERACQQQQAVKSGGGCHWKEGLSSALVDLSELLADENTVSAYELHSSGLIQILLKLFSTSTSSSLDKRRAAKMQKQRVEIFRQTFCRSDDVASAASQLVKKLVSVLESIGKEILQN